MSMRISYPYQNNTHFNAYFKEEPSMNKKRRAALNAITSSLQQYVSVVENILEDEQESYDATPEAFEERREQQEEAISNIEQAIDSLNEAVESLEAASA